MNRKKHLNNCQMNTMNKRNIPNQNIIINCAYFKCTCGCFKFRVIDGIIYCNSCNNKLGELTNHKEK